MAYYRQHPYVEFPECITVITSKRQWYFCRGEAWIPLPVVDSNNIDDLNGITMKYAKHSGLACYIAYLFGDIEKGISLVDEDLRYNERRREVYESLNLPIDEQCYEFAL